MKWEKLHNKVNLSKQKWNGLVSCSQHHTLGPVHFGGGGGGGGGGGYFFICICINFYFQHVTYFPVPVWLMSVSLVDHYEYELLLCPTAIFLFPSSMLPMYPRNTFAFDVCVHTLYIWVCAWACVYRSFVCLCNSNCKHVSMSHVPVPVCTHYVWLIHIDTNYGFFNGWFPFHAAVFIHLKSVFAAHFKLH